MRLLGVSIEGGVIVSAQADEWMKIAVVVFHSGAQERESFLRDTGIRLRVVENFSRSLQFVLEKYRNWIAEQEDLISLVNAESEIELSDEFEVIGHTFSGDLILELKYGSLDIICSSISRAMLVLGPEELQTLTAVEYRDAEEIFNKIEEFQRLRQGMRGLCLPSESLRARRSARCVLMIFWVAKKALDRAEAATTSVPYRELVSSWVMGRTGCPQGAVGFAR